MNGRSICRNAAARLGMVALVVLFVGIGFRELESGDETRVAGIAAECRVEGGYLVPRLNGTPFLEYPPLYYWTAAGAYGVFGINDFAAKFPSVLAAFGMVMLTFAWARKLEFTVPESWCAGFVLLLSTQFFSESRTCRVDMMLALFIELSLFAFYAASKSGTRIKQAGYSGLLVLGLIGGVYTKGLIGMALPLAAIGGWQILADLAGRRISWRGYALMPGGWLIALGCAGIWYALLWRKAGRAMFETAFWTNNLGRFSGVRSDHAESVFYYLFKLPTLFWPWLPVLPFAIWAAIRKIRQTRDAGLLYLIAAVAVPLALLSVASAKRVVYLLPLAAPCALLCGWYFGHLPDGIVRRLNRVASFRTVAAAGIVVAAVVAVGADIGTALVMNRKKSLRPLFAECAEWEKQGRPLILIDAPERTRGAAYFYLRHSIPERSSAEPGGDPAELRIVRDKRSTGAGRKYADHHVLFGGRGGF